MFQETRRGAMSSITAGWRAPAVILPLLQVLCWCFVGPAMAQQIPSCPINIPSTNLTSPAVITIPASGDAVFRLAPGTNYTIAPTTPGSFTVQAGQTICIEGLGADNQAVVIQAVSNSLHLNLQSGSVLHLSGLTLQGDPAIAAGGLGVQPSINQPNLTTVTSSNLRVTKMGQPAIRIYAPVKFTSNNLELVDNVHQDPAAAALVFQNAVGAALNSEFSFQGQTLISGNKGPSFGAGLAFYNKPNNPSNPSLTVEFRGVTKLLRNEGSMGGALAVINEGGSATLRFTGAVLEVRENKAVAPGTGTSAIGGGMFFTNYGATTTSIEFGAESAVFADNIADAAADPAADAGGAALQVYLGAGTLTVSFTKPATFSGNRAFSNINAGGFAGGALALASSPNSAVTLTVASCLSFKDNSLQPYGSANASGVGAALSVANIAQTVAIVVAVSGQSSQLLFSNNTVSGVGQQDVSIGPLSNSAITCPSVPAKGPGLYRVTNDICAASGASVTGGGQIVGPPASCTAGPNACTGLPANITNANGWQCPFSDVSPEGSTCSASCVPGFIGRPAAICTASVWQTTGSCMGCTAPPPSGDTTLISGYSSCSTSLITGSYTVGTVCIPICVSGSSGGLVSCGQTSPGAVPGWQVTPCKPDCLGNPPAAVPGMTSWSCGARTPAGETCTAACDTGAGWSGGPVAATCTASGWSNATTGSCKRVACIGPPSPQPPNATFTCTSTPIGRSCVATCSPGLSGILRRVCLETGEFGPLEGECVDCAGSPKITTAANATYVIQNSTMISAALFSATMGFANGRMALQATLDGTISCRPEPAQLIGVQTDTPVNVTCRIAGGITPGPHTIALAGLWASGSNVCGTSPNLISPQLATIVAVPPPPPQPAVKLWAAGGTPPCKSTRAVSFTATFNFEVTNANPVNLYAKVETSPSTANCAASRSSGSMNNGQMFLNCSGVFNASVVEVNITLTLFADLPPSSTPGVNTTLISASSTQTVGFVCCVADGRQSVAHVVDAPLVALSNAYCRTCGSRARVDGVWQLPKDAGFPPPPPLEGGVLRTGKITHGPTGSRNDPPASEMCSSDGPDVGIVTARCENWEFVNGKLTSNLMELEIVIPPGSSVPLLQYQARCTAPSPLGGTSSCIAGSYSWRTVSERDNSLKVVPVGTRGWYLTFGILISPAAGCGCQDVYFAVRATGVLALGHGPDSNGTCLSNQAQSSAPADLIAAAKAVRRRVRVSQIPVAPLPAAVNPRRP